MVLLCLKQNKLERKAKENRWKYAIRRQKEALAGISFLPAYSLYALLLCFTVTLSSALYGGIQRFVPDTWIEFLFSPNNQSFKPGPPPYYAAILRISMATSHFWNCSNNRPLKDR